MDIHYDYLNDFLNKNLIYIEIIKNKYLHLMSMLSKVSYIETELFLDAIKNIHNNGFIYIAYIGNINNNTFEIIGSGTVILEQKIIRGLQSVAHIEDIVVHEKFRNQGLSKNIINALVEYSSKNNCYKVILDCSNEVMPIYKKINFKEVGIQMGIYF